MALPGLSMEKVDGCAHYPNPTSPCLAFPFVYAAPTFLSPSLPSLAPLSFSSCLPPPPPPRHRALPGCRMMHLCAGGGLVCHRQEKRSRPIGWVNYLACCGELFALFPLPVNKFLRYSADQSKLTEHMWSFYCVNLDLLSCLRWHWHLYIIFILLPVEQFQKYLQGKWMSPSVPGIINVPLSEGFHW